ncbi:hypothetical protein BY458DRAFT_434937 [Sporodiniella umbellata]|nr:hypothetical protein BY458DRAFT_434937 [Sporodiniella umbellata]
MFTSNDPKKAFISKARIERENREKERLLKSESGRKEQSCSIIQRWWRRRAATRHAKVKMWEEWDQLFSSRDTTILKVYQTIGIYCFLTKKEEQPVRLKLLVKQLVNNKFRLSEDEGVTISFYALLIDTRYMRNTRAYLEVIINQCLSQCASLNTNNGSFGPELTFLLQYLNPNTYKAKQHIDQTYLIDCSQATLQNVAQRILKSTLCRSQLRDCFLQYVQQIVKLQNRSSEQDKQKLNAMILWLTTMTRLTLYPIEHAELSSDSLDMETASVFLWTNTLGIPSIISIVGGTKMIMDRLKKWTLGAVAPFLLNSANKNACMDTLDGNGCLFLLGNIVDLWGSNGGDQIELIKLVSSFLQYINSRFSDRQTQAFPHYHPVFKWSSAKWGNTLPFAVFERVIKQMEHVWSRPFMENAFHDIIHFSFEEKKVPVKSSFVMKLSKKPVEKRTNSGGEMALFSMEVESIFSMYSSLISTFKSQSNIYLDASKQNDINKEPLIQVLLIFCQACSILFLTLDDSDIFENHTPFSPDDLIQISAFLNTFYFSLIQKQTIIASELPPAAASFRSARRLLLQIYDLNMYHPFLPSSHWLLVFETTNTMKSVFTSFFSKKDTAASSFLSSVNQGDPVPLRVLQLMPHTVSFDMRLQVFRDWIMLDRSFLKNTRGTHIVVKRSQVLLDGYRQLSAISATAWKGNIRVSFVNELGMEEAGIDQGGPFKDFITMLANEAFRPNHGLFMATEQNSFYPSPYSSTQGKSHIQLFEFIGKVNAPANVYVLYTVCLI